jgi:CHASE2 domain-containing sensor protein
MPSPEVQANTLATALRGFPLSGTPGWFDFLLTIVAGLVVPVAALRLSFRATLVFAIGAGLLLPVATQLAFQWGSVIAFLYPFLALILSTVATMTSRSWT